MLLGSPTCLTMHDVAVPGVAVDAAVQDETASEIARLQQALRRAQDEARASDGLRREKELEADKVEGALTALLACDLCI